MVNTAFPSRKNSRSISVLPYAYYLLLNGTGTALGQTAFIFDAISDIRFQTVSSGGETIAVSASTDGTNFDTLTPNDDTTGQPAASSNLASGAYTLPLHKYGHYKIFKFTKSAGVQQGIVALALARPWNKPGP